MSSQVKIHPEPITPIDHREPVVNEGVFHDIPLHPAEGQGHRIPHGLLFEENGVYVSANNFFWAAITDDDWIIGRFHNNSVHPIYNQRLKMVKVNLHTQRVLLLSRQEIRTMHFYEPFLESNNSAVESSASGISQRRNH